MRRLAGFIGAIVLATIFVGGSLQAGDAGRESPFDAGAGARALGMGGGFVSIADDASALFYNPAGLSLLGYQEVTFMHMTLFEGSMYDYVAWAYPTVALGGFGFGFMRLGTDDIIRREDFDEIGSFGYTYSQFLLSYGRRLRGGLAAGVTLKIMNQSLDVFSDYGIGVDFGMTGRLYQHISAGILIRDIVPATMELETDEETLPVTLVAGIAARDLQLSPRLSSVVTFDIEKTETRSANIHTGMELSFDKRYALRAGYDHDNIAFGAGVIYRGLKIDYAYKVLGHIEDSHRFSLSYLIGSSISDKIEAQELAEKHRSTNLLADERHRKFDFYSQKADDFYQQYRLDSALTYFYRSLAFDEENQRVIDIIAAIESARKVQAEEARAVHEVGPESSKTLLTYIQQAQNFYSKKYYPAALDMLQLVLDIDPNNKVSRELYRVIEKAMAGEITGGIYDASKARSEGDYIHAIEIYTRILYLDPKQREARIGMKEVAQQLDMARLLNHGIELFRSGRYGSSRKQFLAVLAVNSGEPVAREYLGRIDNALAHPPTLEMIQQDRPVWQHYLDGLRFMRDKDYQKAINAWEQVLDAYPNNENTLNNIEQAHLRMQLEKQE